MMLPMRLVLPLLLAAVPAYSDPATVEAVAVSRVGEGWRFDVTIRHPDTGWDDYADGWEVVDATGARLGYRELLHPHVTEQPFTRSLSGVVIPEGTARVFVRARESVGGWGEALFAVDLPK